MDRGLCDRCAHVYRVRNERGSVFLNCTRSRTDPRFPKYPPQPVIRCPGYEPQERSPPSGS